MRGEWMNPTDADNPSNGTHKAVLPTPQEDAAELSSKQKKKKGFPIFRRRSNPESL